MNKRKCPECHRPMEWDDEFGQWYCRHDDMLFSDEDIDTAEDFERAEGYDAQDEW
jgi:endogenous inhibitor of DNA gyrase (YacG/DUF329 family)